MWLWLIANGKHHGMARNHGDGDGAIYGRSHSPGDSRQPGDGV